MDTDAVDTRGAAAEFGLYAEDWVHRWLDALSHFSVGKVTARWPAPTEDSAWIAAAPPRDGMTCSSATRNPPSRMSIIVVGHWARVFVTWCDTGATDEVWLLRMGKEWKIGRLMRRIPHPAGT